MHNREYCGVKPLVRFCFYLIFIGVFCISGIRLTSATQAKPDNDSAREKNSSFDVCAGGSLNYRIACDPSWRVIEGEEATLYRISESPMVTVTIAKTKASIKFLEQLTFADLLKTARYAEGFKTEHIAIGGNRALKVKAFSADFSQSRLSDIYFVHEGALWGIFFSVSPHEEWGNYQFVLQNIINSFELLDSTKAVKEKKRKFFWQK